MPRVSIVTVCRNPGERLWSAIDSVANQRHGGCDIEHLIIDGASTDGTVDRLRAHARPSLQWWSEPDAGISDAFNKGLARAQGEFLGLLNADDTYTAGALDRAIAALDSHSQAGFCYGHCQHIEADGRLWLNLANPRYFDRMRWFMPDVNHPTMLVRRSAYAQVGPYDPRYRYAMDYDWLHRAEQLRIRGIMVDAVQARMAMGGCSDRHWRQAYAEARDIAIRYGAPRGLAHIDHLGRICKGLTRRMLTACGATAMVGVLRRWRQRRIVVPAAGRRP